MSTTWVSLIDLSYWLRSMWTPKKPATESSTSSDIPVAWRLWIACSILWSLGLQSNVSSTLLPASLFTTSFSDVTSWFDPCSSSPFEEDVAPSGMPVREESCSSIMEGTTTPSEEPPRVDHLDVVGRLTPSMKWKPRIHNAPLTCEPGGSSSNETCARCRCNLN
jgi:hypothetical protein